jgi:hypothetical protein
MTDANDAYDRALQEGYREEARYYTQALQLAERVRTALKQGSGTGEPLGQLHEVFARIEAVEARLAALPRPAFWGGGGPRTKEAKAEVIDLIERVVAEIREGEREAVARRDLLILPVEMGIRARRMQRAYGKGR